MDHLRIGTCRRLITVQSVTRTNPVTAATIAIDGIGLWRCSRMGYHVSFRIKAIDTIVLNSQPGHPIITLAERGHRTTNLHILGGEAPGRELGLMLWQKQQTTLQTAHPKVVLIILEQSPDITGVQVERRTGIFVSAQFMRPLWYPTETLAQRSDKQIPFPVAEHCAQLHILITKNTQIDEIRQKLSATIVQQTTLTYHQHTALIIDECCHRTVR